MIGGLLGYGGISAVVGAILYANLPTRLTIGAIVPTVDYLAETSLVRLEPGKAAAQQSGLVQGEAIQASELFNAGPTLVMAVRRPGCAFCRKEASRICSVSEKLAKRGVKVIGVVHETLGVDQFRPFLGCAEAIYFDPEKRFFGPQQRWLPLWMGFMRVSTYLNYYKTKQAGFEGNTEGEGRLLGGVYLVENRKMSFAHLESEWGDEPNVDQIVAAVGKAQ